MPGPSSPLKTVLTADAMIAAMVKTRGNKRAAADLLGVDRRSLYKYLKMYPEAEAEAALQISRKLTEMIEQSEDIIDLALAGMEVTKAQLMAAMHVTRQAGSFAREGAGRPAPLALSVERVEKKIEQYTEGLPKTEEGVYVIGPPEVEH